MTTSEPPPDETRVPGKSYPRDPARHTRACGGGHTRDISCADVVAWRDRIGASPWICKNHPYGAHYWQDPRPEGTCSNCGKPARDMPRTPYL